MNSGDIWERIGVRREGSKWTLNAGVHDLTEPLVIDRSALRLCGQTENGHAVSRIRRGKQANGDLYDGPLIVVKEQSDVTLSDFIVDGARFEGEGARRHDHRHPLTSDRTDARFPCGRAVPPPQCYLHENFVSSISPDIVINGSRRIKIERLLSVDAVRIGLAIGRGCSEIALEELDFLRAGDYGLWMGFGFASTAPLPLPAEHFDGLPAQIHARRCFFDSCGGSAAYIEANGVTFLDSVFIRNHFDFPYNDEGGQVCIDYRANDVRLENCEILAGPQIERSALPNNPGSSENLDKTLLGVVGIEASGQRISLINTIIEGNSREAVQLVGARDVTIRGARTQFVNNNLAPQIFPRYPANPGRQNLSVTTTAPFAALNAYAKNIRFEQGRCENGVAIWSNGSVEKLTIDGVEIEGVDLSGPNHSGIYVGENGDGSSLRGDGWKLSPGD